ncbi:FadR/GntR family transcriptional regulator [Bauldia sp.]|uniref:FadR/GntR family transcriptional regulator n=1 Tax=Bauldia sp. TaxID=2575872 RepID=UPI003BAAC9F3
MNDARLYPASAIHARLAHDIGRQIVSGNIREGEVLPGEAELAARYKVSRQAIREGLKVLAAKGMITARRRAGTIVTPRRHWNLLDPDVLAWHPIDELPESFLKDLVEIRQVMEPFAVVLAAKRGTDANIARIGAELDAMKAEGGYSDAFYAADTRFHIAVFSAAGNMLIEKLSAILVPMLSASFRHRGRVRGAFEVAIARHEAVYDAIKERDPVAARNAMERLLDFARSEFSQSVGLDKGEAIDGVTVQRRIGADD